MGKIRSGPSKDMSTQFSLQKVWFEKEVRDKFCLRSLIEIITLLKGFNSDKYAEKYKFQLPNIHITI